MATEIELLRKSKTIGPVVFSAFNRGHDTVTGDVTYTDLVANVGDGFDIETGTFICPKDGLYLFSFSGTTRINNNDGTSSTSVHIMVNGAQEFVIANTQDREEFADYISHTWMSNLSMGDTVHLQVTNGYLTSGPLIDQNGQRITFNGHLLY